MSTNNRPRTWVCFLCGSKYPNTLLYCPKCDIARKHSFTLESKQKQKLERKSKIYKKRNKW